MCVHVAFMGAIRRCSVLAGDASQPQVSVCGCGCGCVWVCVHICACCVYGCHQTVQCVCVRAWVCVCVRACVCPWGGIGMG